ncbi:3-methylfumaryl-CoA hydratase [Geodermatophilus dictyosporus]|uniref:3-methylfumaryl-CoA hydratase n=1 Tax=Geodermatophilus dictyosporus TaxID=1523247 RepID=A0A1I5SKF2_9ACTN|nr:MaoC family dehydratase N-terminal domain-containing protein [Geodermatophilus dictyosporus]SFP71230.1 3-methylfumaryl-CoA hydratase [Geodermatophilus dictyosporus]
MTLLASAVEGWSPGPVTATARIGAGPAAAFAALLDQPAPPLADGDPLPPGWHWFAFLDHPATADLGEDGHPRAGAFLPPIPHRRRMIAGGRLEVTAPLRVGSTVTRTSGLARCEPRSGRSGPMLLVTVRSEYREDGRLLLIEEQDVVYRSQEAGSSPAPAGTGTPAPGGDGPAVELRPDEAVLFRFSALTYNAHRIHYDHPYATRVEGHPGLVVHGPLLALLLLEVPRRHTRDRAVASFAHRLTRPAYAGTPVRAVGRADGDRLELSAAAAGAPSSVTGTALLTGGDR